MNKKLVSMGILIVLFLTSFSVFGVADAEVNGCQITRRYSFDTPVMKSVDLDSLEYAQVSIDGATSTGNPGEPRLPAYGVYMLIPQGEGVSDITVTHGDRICLGSGFMVEPVGEPLFFSEIEKGSLPFFNNKVYSSNEEFPGRLFTEIGRYWCRGYQVLVLMLHPLQYIPATGELFFYPDLMVSVETVEDNRVNSLYRGFEKDRQLLMNKVDNLEIVNTYTEPLKVSVSVDNYDLLIITSDSLKDGFEPLAQAHNDTGVRTVIKTLSDIGGSSPEDIRDCIRDAYNSWGVGYVLLGGDSDVIPFRDLYVVMYPVGVNRRVEEHMPSDFYYGCLDGPFNFDGDDRWGETNDGEGGGDVDLMAEVYVGRACVSNLVEVCHFVNKTVSYISIPNDDPYLKKAVFLGEYMGSNARKEARWSGYSMDELIDGCQNKFTFVNMMNKVVGVTTFGIPSSVYDIDKLYDRDWPGNDWPVSELINRINNGVHFVNNLGHSNYSRNMKMIIADVDNLGNDKYCFVYSQGCMAGGFDNPEGYDCIAEHFTVKNEHGAYAGIWNARYGIGSRLNTDGPSQRFHREFWDAVFNESIWQIGRANQDSKEDNLWHIKDPGMRWCYYELNLFGDPTLELLHVENNNPPSKPEKPQGPTRCRRLLKYTYTTSAVDPDGDCLHYGWDWTGDFEVEGWTDTEWMFNHPSGEEVSMSHRWFFVIFDHTVRVKAKDVYGAESEWSDPLNVSVYIGGWFDRIIQSQRTSQGISSQYSWMIPISQPSQAQQIVKTTTR